MRFGFEQWTITKDAKNIVSFIGVTKLSVFMQEDGSRTPSSPTSRTASHEGFLGMTG